jgi:S-adenosylmethionine synthetase
MVDGKYYLTSESVAEGHPDKVCDQISDAVLDEVLKDDPKGRVACETFITVGLVIVGGEITTNTYVEIGDLVRNVVKDIGYTHSKYGFNYETCAVLNAIGRQSPDIAQGVDIGGAGDQGLMIGYAVNETDSLMPLPIYLAHKLTMQMKKVRIEGILPYLGPDGKSQVTIEYEKGKPVRIDAVVLACQHTEDILDETGKKITNKARDEMIEKIAFQVLPKEMIDKNTKFYVNPTGKFVVGGPQSDTGMTGRKIIVDTYGGAAPHGGGAFSGKDPTKVDRSATYMARHIAKNIVASGISSKCLVQLAYAIGVADPVSVFVEIYDGEKIDQQKLIKVVREIFPLTPKGIINYLNLLRPIYKKTACFGHFGRDEEEFLWEKTNKAEELRKAILG